MLLASDCVTIGEKWTTVLPSKIDVAFFTVQWYHTLGYWPKRYNRWEGYFSKRYKDVPTPKSGQPVAEWTFWNAGTS